MKEKTMYQFGELVFELENSAVPVPENVEKFRVEQGNPSYFYSFELADALSWDRSDFQVRKDPVSIAIEGGLETRYLCFPESDHPYAISRELDDSHTRVTVDRRDLEWFRYDNVFCSLLSPERRMLGIGAFVLHSAYIIYRGEAILFTAPSCVGKSTQAALWAKYRGAEVINGDRSLLQFRDGKLWVSGWPVCGSSGICQNRSYPVHAIVLLEQAKENRVDQLSVREYTLRLMREITINYHNPQFFDAAMAFIERLTEGSKLWHLRCNISEDAVESLHRALYGEEEE